MRTKSHEEWAAELVGRMYRCGITSKDLAKRTGFTPPYISMLLNGKKHATEETRLKLFDAVSEMEREVM